MKGHKKINKRQEIKFYKHENLNQITSLRYIHIYLLKLYE